MQLSQSQRAPWSSAAPRRAAVSQRLCRTPAAPSRHFRRIHQTVSASSSVDHSSAAPGGNGGSALRAPPALRVTPPRLQQLAQESADEEALMNLLEAEEEEQLLLLDPDEPAPLPEAAAAAAAAPPALTALAAAAAGAAPRLGGVVVPPPPAPGSAAAAAAGNGSECPVVIDSTGNPVECMCCDYGFRSGRGRVVAGYGEIPRSAWHLAWTNFANEWQQLRRSFRYDEYDSISRQNPPSSKVAAAGQALGSAIVRLFAWIDQGLEERQLFSRLLPAPLPAEVVSNRTGSLSSECRSIRVKLAQLTLSNDAVWDRERAREAAGGGVETPWLVRVVYLSLCTFLDVFYENRPLQRFWFLETVARMPYFSYITMLHLYESLGWWRAGAELRKVHFAEEWNELHHLQIMESLGGDQLWIDRFMAQHAAIVYYWILLGLFIASPALAYNFSELIEAHAVDTYGEFADANAALLRSLPPPAIAVEYYRGADLYQFDAFQTSGVGRGAVRKRRPACSNLYDVFCNIRDDEGEHVATMAACQDGSIVLDLERLRAPPAQQAPGAAAAPAPPAPPAPQQSR